MPTAYLVHVPPSVSQCQIDDFPPGCERSVKGSLRVSPGTLQLTEGEFQHLKTRYKALHGVLRVILGPQPVPHSPPPPKAMAVPPVLADLPSETEADATSPGLILPPSPDSDETGPDAPKPEASGGLVDAEAMPPGEDLEQPFASRKAEHHGYNPHGSKPKHGKKR